MESLRTFVLDASLVRAYPNIQLRYGQCTISLYYFFNTKLSRRIMGQISYCEYSYRQNILAMYPNMNLFCLKSDRVEVFQPPKRDVQYNTEIKCAIQRVLYNSNLPKREYRYEILLEIRSLTENKFLELLVDIA